MSKAKSRKIDRRRERRILNNNLDAIKHIGHGFHTGWKRFLTRHSIRGNIEE